MTTDPALAESPPTAGGAVRPTSPLARRLFDTIVSPGRMAAEMADHPRWIGALLVGMALVALATALIPTETMMEVQRRAALERGVEVPPTPESVINVLRWVIPVFSAISVGLMTALLAGVYAIALAFVLGDEGTFRQYLAVAAHATFVPALASLLVTPLRIITEDPQFTLNLGSLLFFVPRGYWFNVFRVMDLTQIWSLMILALGAGAIDKRRGFWSAASVGITLFVGLALVLGRFIPS